MDLARDDWQASDIAEFLTYLASLGKGEESAAWEKRIINTAMPCIAVPSTDIARIVRGIAKGNYRAFIACWCWANYSASAVLGKLICRLPYEEQAPLLLRYAAETDTWAGTDSLTFAKAKPTVYVDLAKRCIADPHTFVRRLGVIIMLKCITPDTIDDILATLPALWEETEYYVNMAVAWLLADCFIKYRDRTLRFLDEGEYNAFVAQKAVSKCRDSFRVSPEDKQMLLRYRKKD